MCHFHQGWAGQTFLQGRQGERKISWDGRGRARAKMCKEGHGKSMPKQQFHETENLVKFSFQWYFPDNCALKYEYESNTRFVFLLLKLNYVFGQKFRYLQCFFLRSYVTFTPRVPCSFELFLGAVRGWEGDMWGRVGHGAACFPSLIFTINQEFWNLVHFDGMVSTLQKTNL